MVAVTVFFFVLFFFHAKISVGLSFSRELLDSKFTSSRQVFIASLDIFTPHVTNRDFGVIGSNKAVVYVRLIVFDAEAPTSAGYALSMSFGINTSFKETLKGCLLFFLLMIIFCILYHFRMCPIMTLHNYQLFEALNNLSFYYPLKLIR